MEGLGCKRSSTTIFEPMEKINEVRGPCLVVLLGLFGDNQQHVFGSIAKFGRVFRTPFDDPLDFAFDQQQHFLNLYSRSSVGVYGDLLHEFCSQLPFLYTTFDYMPFDYM